MLAANSEWVELIPAGTFYTNDGRGPFYNYSPADVVSRSRVGIAIDFDHAMDRAAPHGLPAPAAGWIRAYRIVAGAIQARIEWTPKGAAALESKEYRFISPVFTFDRPSGAGDDVMIGRVIAIQRAALTNNPALDQLPALAASREHRNAISERKKMNQGKPVVAMTEQERKVYNQALRMSGVSEEQFAAALADRRAGRPFVLSSRAFKEDHKSGLVGPQIAREAFEEHRDEIQNESANSRTLAQEAVKSISEYLTKPDAPDAWKILARAAAMITGALDRIGPPYADRVIQNRDGSISWK